MRRFSILGILVFGVVTGSTGAQTPAPSEAGGAVREDAARTARVDAVFADYAKPGSPGCAVGVYQDDRVLLQQAYGMANLDHDVPLATSSVFHVASVSKQFTAAAILLLAQDGKLSLDDEVRKYVPELPDFGPRLTIRQLAHHTSGIRDQWDLLGLAGWRYSRDLITDDDVLGLLARQKDLNFTPGERHLYSNSGYTLMAVIVSRVSGQSFREFTTSRIFRPLGMTNTHFRDNFNEVVKNQAYGYAPDGQGFRLSVTNFDTAGATSLLTTVEDMVKWHANFDRRTVGGERLQAALHERGVLNDGSTIDYAFGVVHGTYRGLATVGHGGADAGYRSSFLRFPDRRLGIACLCNISTANPGALAQRVADVFLPDTLPPAARPADEEPEASVTAAELALYAGLYWSETLGFALRYLVDDGRLVSVAGSSRTPMKPLGAGRFVGTTGARAQVRFDRSGGEVVLKAGQNFAEAYVRVEPHSPTRAELDAFAGVYRSDEMDAVFRMVASGEELRLQRIKAAPAPLEPLMKDTFRTPVGTLRFTRAAAGGVSGFVLEAGRLRRVKFWKDRTGQPAPGTGH